MKWCVVTQIAAYRNELVYREVFDVCVVLYLIHIVFGIIYFNTPFIILKTMMAHFDYNRKNVCDIGVTKCL